MVLLTEMERIYSDEIQIANDSTVYSKNATCDWITLATKSVTLNKELLLFIKANMFLTGNVGTLQNCFAFRISIDGLPIYSSGGISSSVTGDSYFSPDLYLLLAAGTHSVTFDVSYWLHNGAGTSIGYNLIYIAQLNFNDMLSLPTVDSGVQTWTAGNSVTAINQNVAVPVDRALPVGSLAKYACFVYVQARDAAGSPTRKTHLKNVGDSDDATKNNIKLYINGAQVSWISKANDDADGNASNPSYGRGANGYYVASIATNQTLNVQVTANGSASGSEEIYVTVFLCPWLTPTNLLHSPVNLNFSQGSTFYAYVEPMYDNVGYGNAATIVLTSFLGKIRFFSFGNATDYYSIASATGAIMIHSYLFDVVDVATCVWSVQTSAGAGSSTIACISYIGADIR